MSASSVHPCHGVLIPLPMEVLPEVPHTASKFAFDSSQKWIFSRSSFEKGTLEVMSDTAFALTFNLMALRLTALELTALKLTALDLMALDLEATA